MLLSNFLKLSKKILFCKDQKEVVETTTKPSKIQVGRIYIESIDNYDNGYRGIFPHKITELKLGENFCFKGQEELSIKKLKPIYEKRNYTKEELKMIDDFLANNKEDSDDNAV
jgi:hypothetical protein